jgi:hypothetical protein
VSIDIDAITKRDNTQYGMECDNDAIGTTLQYALTDRNDLLREVARLRAEVERERAAVVEWLRFAYLRGAAAAIERGEHRRKEEA